MSKAEDIAEALELHNLSVSGDPKSEAVGRLMKNVMNGHREWVHDEMHRGVSMPNIVRALIESHLGMAHMCISQLVEMDDTEGLRLLGDAYRTAFRSYADFLDKSAEKPNKRRRKP